MNIFFLFYFLKNNLKKYVKIFISYLIVHRPLQILNLFVMFMLLSLSMFLSMLFIIILTYYYCYCYYYWYLPILILENLRTINNLKSAKAISIKPGQKLCHKCRITILKAEQDYCMQIGNNNQYYESPKVIDNNDPGCEFQKNCVEKMLMKVLSFWYFLQWNLFWNCIWESKIDKYWILV